MEGIMTFTAIIMIVFGVLQIILFFKIWGMTNNVKSLKNLYSERSEKLNSNIDVLVSNIKSPNPSNFERKENEEIAEVVTSKDVKGNYVQSSKKENSANENCDEYKRYLQKWKVLKDRGYTEQAMNEYMEYTKRDRNSAVEFLNSL